MAAVCYLAFSKIAVLVMSPVLACDSVFPIQIRINRSIWRRDIAKNDFQYGVHPPS